MGGFNVETQARLVRPTFGMVLTGSGGLLPRATALENLIFFGALYRMKKRDAIRRANVLLDQFGLVATRDTKVNTYSTGMRQRLLLARSLMHDPPILLLDEPTTGLDPEAASAFRALVQDLKYDGKAILFCSHNLSEVAELSNSIMILSDGTTVASGSPSAVVSRTSNLITVALDIPHMNAHLIPTLIAIDGVDNHSRTDDATLTRLRLVTHRPEQLEVDIRRVFVASAPPGMYREPATLEDAYMYILKAARSSG